MRRAALCLWLCALALRLQPVVSQIVATNVPPEDQDGSGDDSDNFSGSGAGALQDILSQWNPSTWKDTGLLTVMPTAVEPTGINSVAAATSIQPAVQGDEKGETVLLTKVEPGFATHPPSETTPHPTTHQVPTRATTAQAPITSPPHRDIQPDHPKTSAPEGVGQPDPHTPSIEDGGPSATERAAEVGPVTQFSTEESSGDPDFTFEVPGESTPGPTVVIKQQLKTVPPPDLGASQGLLDRKEVLGGVIAAGLVGLIFAVCLVGFMLYRMKKKDEGSYSLEEPKQANGGAYQKPSKQEEFYA